MASPGTPALADDGNHVLVPGVDKFAVTAMRGGEVADFVTASLRVVPRRALDKGYTFRYPELEPALRDLLGR